MLFLRNAAASDLPQIMKIEDASFIPKIRESADVFSERIKVFPEGFVVFSEGGGAPPAGYLCGELWDGIPESADAFLVGHDIAAFHRAGGKALYISSFALLPEFRGMGEGRRLFARALEHICEKTPVAALLLLVNEEWNGARRIYKDFGFEEVRRIPMIFPSEDGGFRTGIVMARPFGGRWQPAISSETRSL